MYMYCQQKGTQYEFPKWLSSFTLLTRNNIELQKKRATYFCLIKINNYQYLYYKIKWGQDEKAITTDLFFYMKFQLHVKKRLVTPVYDCIKAFFNLIA